MNSKNSQAQPLYRVRMTYPQNPVEIFKAQNTFAPERSKAQTPETLQLKDWLAQFDIDLDSYGRVLRVRCPKVQHRLGKV